MGLKVQLTPAQAGATLEAISPGIGLYAPDTVDPTRASKVLLQTSQGWLMYEFTNGKPLISAIQNYLSMSFPVQDILI